MFSRIYSRNVDGGNGQGSGKSSRIRITLRDRINSKESTSLQTGGSSSLVGHKEGDDSLLVRRNNTIGRIIQNGSQQVFYPVNPNSSFARHQMRGRYNSNMVQNSYSGVIQYKGSTPDGLVSQSISGREINSIRQAGPGSDLTSRSSSNSGMPVFGVQQIRGMIGAKARSMVSSIPLDSVERDSAGRQMSSKSQMSEIEDSENEGVNSNRNKPGLSFELYSLSEDPKKRVGLELSPSKEERPVSGMLVSGSISLKKERLPYLEILPTKVVSRLEDTKEGRDKPNSAGDDHVPSTLMGQYSKEVNELIPMLNKSSAFYFVRFNLLLHLAAIVIQCYFRRYLCRKYFNLRKLGPIKLLNASAVRIQACWRSFLTRFGVSLCRGAFSDGGRYYWSVLHEKKLCEITKKRNSNAACIQRFWRNVYMHNINIEREILSSSIFSARSLARETLWRFLIGYYVRRNMDSKFKLVPIRWGWSIQEISQIFILQRTANGWSEPKKMWFSQDKNLYEYNLFLPNGVHLIIFKVYYRKDISGERGEFKLLCNSSLETTPNKEFQFVNSITVNGKNYTVSAFKHLRSVISSGTQNLARQDSDTSHYMEDDNDLDYISLSPSYKQTLDREYLETDYTNSPFKDSDIVRNDVIGTPSTNMDYSPEIQHFIH